MKSTLMLITASLALAACAPNYPAAQEPVGNCRNSNCILDGQPSQKYFSKFMTGVEGSCANPAGMTFTSMVAQYVSPKSNVGYAEIRLFIDPVNGLYKGAYAAPAEGTAEPVITPIEGKYYLENTAIVLEGLGIGHKSTPEQMMVQVLSSSTLDIAFSPQISFIQDKSLVNEKGETAAQVCAAQAQAPAQQPAK